MPRTHPNEAPRTIRASEIGEYSYCSRAWWYRHVIKLPAPDDGSSNRLAQGVESHHRHGRQVANASALRLLGIALALLGLLALVAALLLKG